MYRPSHHEEWPELLGKLTPSGGTMAVGSIDVRKVFDALRRISGDERRMMQVGGRGRGGGGVALQTPVDGIQRDPHLRHMTHIFPHIYLFVQVFRTFDKDRSNSLELPEIMEMCRHLFNMSFNEACFVQVRGGCSRGGRGETSLVSVAQLEVNCSAAFGQH